MVYLECKLTMVARKRGEEKMTREEVVKEEVKKMKELLEKEVEARKAFRKLSYKDRFLVNFFGKRG